MGHIPADMAVDNCSDMPYQTARDFGFEPSKPVMRRMTHFGRSARINLGTRSCVSASAATTADLSARHLSRYPLPPSTAIARVISTNTFSVLTSSGSQRLFSSFVVVGAKKLAVQVCAILCSYPGSWRSFMVVFRFLKTDVFK